MRADTSQLDAALAKSSGELGGLSAAAAKSSTGMSAAFTKAGQSMTSLGTKMSTTGRHLTTSVTLPIAAIGAVATKSALDFNTAFAKIGALAGKIGTSTADAEKHVKALAEATGQAPQDLANSLYFIASAGLKANKVMDTLDITAKAAATGMGSASDIGQTLTSVLNAFSGQGYDATKVMNIFTEAVKLGKAETSDFATGLGPIIGVAANAGVSLAELTGAIAQATNLGIPFDRAVTGLRYSIQSLMSPTDTATKALKGFGINAGDLAGMVAGPQGLTGTLQYLYDKLNDGSVAGRKAWSSITGGARSSIVAVDLVGKHQDQTNNIIGQMGQAAQDSATTFNDAYKKIQATPAFKFQQALASLKVAAIDLGNVLIPVLVNDVVPAIKSAVEWFVHLSDGTKSLLVKFAVGAAAAGPLLMFVGSILKIGGAASKAIGAIGALTKAAAGLNVAGSVASATTGAQATAAASTGGGVLSAAFGTAFLAGTAAALEQGAPPLFRAWYTHLTGSSTLGNLASSLGKKLVDFALTGSATTAIPDFSASKPVPNEVPKSLFDTMEAARKAGVAFNEEQGAALRAALANKNFANAQTIVQSAMHDTIGTIAILRNTLGADAQDWGKWGQAIIDSKATLPNKQSFTSFIAGLNDSGIHIQGWAKETGQSLATAGHFTEAMDVMAQSVSKSDLVGGLKKLGGDISNTSRQEIKGEIAHHQYAAAFYDIVKASNAATAAEEHSTAQLRALTDTVLTNTNAYNDLGTSFNYYNKLSVSQTALIERNVQKLYDQGDALTTDEQKALRAAIAHGKFSKAQEIVTNALNHVNGVLTSYNEKLGKTAEEYLKNNRAMDDMGNALINNNKLTVSQTTAVEKQVNALYDSGKALTASEKKALDAAIASGKFKVAQEILTNALKGNTDATDKNGNTISGWKDKVLNGTDATKKQSDALKALTDQLPNNTDKLSANVQELINQATKADTAKEKATLLRQALEDMSRGKYDINIGANTQVAINAVKNLISSMKSDGFTLDLGNFHTGGMIGDTGKQAGSALGLKPNERPIIALADEMVMNPRATREHRSELEAWNSAPRRHSGGMVDPASEVAVLTPYIKAIQGAKPPNFTVNVDISDKLIAALKDQFAPLIPKGGGGAWGGYENGRIPLSALTPIGNGKYLAPFAATAFKAMQASYGHNIDVVSAYRSYAEQASIYGSGVRPAAPPGQSMHGWGEAIDVAGGATTWLPDHSRPFNWYRGVSFGDPNHYSYGFSADNGAFFKKRTDVSMMPGEVALAPDSMQSVRALSKAMGQAARLHDGGAVAPSGALVESGRNHNQDGDGFHLGKYRQLLDLIGTHHIDRILEKVKKLYRSEDQFPKDYVTGTLRRANLHQLHKVAPNRDDIADFVKHLAENVDAHQGGGQGGHDSGGDGLHLGKYRHLLNIIDARHIKAKVAHVKELYGEQHNFPTKYVLGTLGKADMRDVHKVAPNVNSKRAFVQKLAELARGHGGGGGGGGGNGQGGHGGGAGGIGGGLFGKVFGDFDKTLGMAATQQLADQFVGKLKDEYGDTHALNIGQITKVVDAMFQQVPAENYLNALTTRWENAVHGKTVKLADKSGRSYAVTQAILKLLGAHQGTGGGAGGGTGGSGGGDQGALAYHLGPLSKLLKELKVNHPQSVIDNVKKRYEPHHQFPFDWLGNILSGASLKDIHKVDAKAKSLKDFMQDLANGIDHSPHGGNSGGGNGGGGVGGGGGGNGGHGGSRIDQLIRDHKHWDRASASQSHQLARWMLDRNVNGLKSPSAFHDLSYIIARESNWRWNAGSPPHAYGIPQSLPGNKMRTSGADWLTNSQTQEDWMFKYIKGRYHTMSQALQHKKATGWYGSGLDRVFTQPTTIGVGERGPEHVTVTPLGKSSNDLKIQLRVDRKRFNRDMDLDYVVSGR